MRAESIACNYVVKKENRSRELVINCKDCSDDFELEECIGGIILAMEGEYNIDMLILSDYLEKQYSKEVIDVLKDVRDISEELESLASRRMNKKKCSDCGINPGKMYSEMRSVLVNSPGDIYATFSEYSKMLMRKEGCNRCRKASKEELTLIGERLLGLRNRIMREAFDVVG
ncbi:MAG: hypothetical protein R6U61_05930 [Thermoplasmata archaeon]